MPRIRPEFSAGSTRSERKRNRSGAELIKPEDARRYVASKFGDDLDDVRSALRRLAKSYQPKELASRSFGLYDFPPAIPQGIRGWGAKGNLNLAVVEG
jgi:hypothetical protein